MNCSEAPRVPAALGLNNTLILQLAPAARLVVQLSFDRIKSPALVPPSPPPVIVNVAVPELVSVSTCGALVAPTAWLPNSIDEGLKVSPAAAVPVPDRLTVCVLPAALLVIDTATVGISTPPLLNALPI